MRIKLIDVEGVAGVKLVCVVEIGNRSTNGSDDKLNESKLASLVLLCPKIMDVCESVGKPIQTE